MQLNETLAFVTVVDSGSFTAAGRRLGIPKSTLSRQVSRLEERLGARLLQRTTRKLSLTEMGAAYFERCKQAIDDISDAERVARDVAGRPAGRLRVSCSFDFAHSMLAPALPAFHARYPEITLSFLLTQERTDLLAEGIDVALRGGMMPGDGYVARKLAESPLILCATPGYLCERGRPGDASALASHACLSMRLPPHLTSWPMTGPDGLLRVTLEPWLEANEFGFLVRMVRAGQGIGLVLENMVRDELEAGELERVLPELAVSGGGLFAIYPSRHHLSPKVRVFVDWLVELTDGY